MLAGTPAFIFAPDGRILELARYHNIPHMLAADITDDTDIFKVYERADFSSVQRGHAERFAHYADFLVKNGLSHIYMEGASCGQSPFDLCIFKRRCRKTENACKYVCKNAERLCGETAAAGAEWAGAEVYEVKQARCEPDRYFLDKAKTAAL